tara:strand:+ start:135 stop:308 length:174 start_codon:yes stop_codon:yes gene_type:complete
VIPKSITPSCIPDNAAVFDFALSEQEAALISLLGTGKRGGPEGDQHHDLQRRDPRRT